MEYLGLENRQQKVTSIKALKTFYLFARKKNKERKKDVSYVRERTTILL
jgi:hypothetical protein